MTDEFGNRMKKYEKLAQQQFMPLLPVCIRLDGRSFSKWTKSLKRPYDIDMMKIMKHVTIKLVEETNAVIGYTQSDEISLILYESNPQSQIYFDGKIQKIISSTAAYTSVIFNQAAAPLTDPISPKLATFDCRAWQVPNKTEAVNALLWRQQDATKNSISMAARSVYSHKQLMNKNGKEMQDMLMEKGINWNNYPSQFKRGIFVQRKKVERKFTIQELKLLPKEHEAKNNHDLVVKRTEVVALDLLNFSKIINKNDVVFLGSNPIHNRVKE